ncbi:MAG: VOC family protein [Pseudomonadota bacterium]
MTPGTVSFVNPLPFVKDMARAVAFYRDVVGLTLVEDAGDFARFEGGFALHDGAALHQAIFGDPPDNTDFGCKNIVLYFETEDLEQAYARIATASRIIHPIQTQHWGGRVFRAYDPDGHILEFGEPSTPQT